MFRNRALWLTIVTLSLTSLACNAFAGSLEPSLAPPPTAVGESSASSTPDLVATATLPVLSPVPSSQVTMLVDLNVRSGPGVQYDRIGFLLKGESAPIIGVHAESGWWKIECPENSGETDCWISGGEQYTRADEADSVAEVDAPPTPTPIPPELEKDTGVVAFIDDGRLFAAQVDLTQDPPRLAVEPVQLADAANVQTLAISPDGRRVAYVSGTSEANSLHVVNIDGQDHRTLVISNELPLGVVQNATGFGKLVYQVQWLPNGEALAFNTTIVNLDGPGVEGEENLWLVTLDGDLTESFPSGEGGGAFVITANNQVLLSRSDNIARANLDGSDIGVTLQFDFINTASEVVYYPVLQMTNDGEIFVAIPDAEPWQPDARTFLWQIPGTGQAGQLGSIDGVTLFDQVQWSPNGGRLAFIQQPADPDSPEGSRLVIADSKGINTDPYAGGDLLAFHAWGPDSTSFLYSGDGFYAVGREGAPPIQTLLSSGQRVNGAQWITDTAFMAAVGIPENNTWELNSASLSGEKIPITTFRASDPVFDVWQPG